MEELDGDAVRLSFNGRAAARGVFGKLNLWLNHRFLPWNLFWWKSILSLDIVQFVPYRDAYSWMTSTVGPGYGGPPTPAAPSQQSGSWATPNDATHKLAQVKLAQEVLAEIPDQVTSYMKSRGIFPGKTHSASSKSRLVASGSWVQRYVISFKTVKNKRPTKALY